MGTIRRITDLQLGSINTMKVLSITSAGTTYTINSGNRAFELTNLGANNVFYNNTVVLGTGGFISSQGSKFWDTIVDNFTFILYVTSGGVTNPVVIQEYAGN